MTDLDFPTRVLGGLETHCLGLGRFDSVNKGQPDQQPGNGMSAAIWLNNIRPPRGQSGLAATSLVLVYNIRLFKPLTSFPQEQIETDMLEAVAALMASLTADFTLADGIRGIDLLGMSGSSLEAVAGYTEQDGVQYRVMTVTVPCIINDVWDQEA